jgi:hypothetical protein
MIRDLVGDESDLQKERERKMVTFKPQGRVIMKDMFR